MEEDKQSLNGMPLPLLIDRARNETLMQVQNIMGKYQMPAFLYTSILSEILHAITDVAVKEKKEAEQYWARKQAEENELKARDINTSYNEGKSENI